jgi:hypothetical protein
LFGKNKFAADLRFVNIILMSKAFDEITKEAIQLPRDQRLELAGLLLELDARSNDSDGQAAWEQEIRARIMAVDEGRAIGVPYDEVMQAAEDRLGS